jgi:predicted RNA-binding Zn-ribbon protein involved in translation (DUF1610 family)
LSHGGHRKLGQPGRAYAQAVPPSKKNRRRAKSVLTCPQCGSADMYYEAALITGYKYHCKKCGYIGAFVIERDLEDQGFVE